MKAHYLEPLINPRSIAILGASADAGRVGGMPLQLLIQHGFAGPIYPINPKYPEISGFTCYPDVESLPEPVDLIALAVAAREVVPQLRRAAAKGVRSAVVFASGFAETGDEEGRRLQDELEACVAELGMPVAGPNCMGFANLATHAYTAFASVFRNIEPPRERYDTALITQSGNVCAAVYTLGRARGVRFGSVLNTGNEATIEFSEYLDYFAQDPTTKVIAGYVEGLRDGDRFRRVAARLRDEGRPLILLKIGDTAKGAEAAASHTAALAGSQAVYRAVFDDLNVMMADDLGHLADLSYLAGFRDRRAGQRLAILTISGALGALLSDKFVKAGIDIPTLPQDVQDVLRSGIPTYGMVANPVDLTGNVVNQHEFIRDAMAALQRTDAVDMILVYAPGYLLDKLAPAVIDAAKASNRLIVAVDTGNAKSRGDLEAAGVPVFDDTARAVAAVSTFARWSERGSAARPVVPARANVARSAMLPAGTALNEVEAKGYVASFGVPVGKNLLCADREAAAMAAASVGFPAVLKILSRDILHKSDIGGVRLGLSGREEAARAFDEVVSAARGAMPDAEIDGVVVQPQEKPGLEVLVGITRDAVFGPVMTAGLGGIFTEILQDVAHRLLPVGAGDAEAMLRSLKGFPLLDGARGRPRLDVPALADAMASLSAAFLAGGERIEELEINPLVVRKQGEGVVALDCVITLKDQEAVNETAERGRNEWTDAASPLPA